MDVRNNSHLGFVARDIQNSQVHVGAGPAWVQPLEVERVWNLPTGIRPAWVAVSGALSLAGSAASIYELFFGAIPLSTQPWSVPGFGLAFVLLGIVGVLLIAFAFILWQTEFLMAGAVAIELDGSRAIRLTRLGGPCPMCTGRLRMHSGPKHDRACYLTCSKNRDHSWRFDYTTLGPAGSDEKRDG